MRKAICVLGLLVLQGCASYPGSFDGSRIFPEGDITHRNSGTVFPGRVSGLARVNADIHEFNPQGTDVQVAYQSQTALERPEFRASIAVFQDARTVDQLAADLPAEIAASHRKQGLATNPDFKTLPYNGKLQGLKITFTGSSRAWTNYGIAAVLKKFDSYDEAYEFKTGPWAISFRFTSGLEDRAEAEKQFLIFVEEFLALQTKWAPATNPVAAASR